MLLEVKSVILLFVRLYRSFYLFWGLTFFGSLSDRRHQVWVLFQVSRIQSTILQQSCMRKHTLTKWTEIFVNFDFCDGSSLSCKVDTRKGSIFGFVALLTSTMESMLAGWAPLKPDLILSADAGPTPMEKLWEFCVSSWIKLELWRESSYSGLLLYIF